MNDKFPHILDRLNQLMDYTRQLSQCEEDPEVDVTYLTGLCKDKLAELQAMMPNGVKSLKGKAGSVEPGADELSHIEEMMTTLDTETRRCIEVLSRCRNRTENELSSLRRRGKAIRAYNKLI